MSELASMRVEATSDLPRLEQRVVRTATALGLDAGRSALAGVGASCAALAVLADGGSCVVGLRSSGGADPRFEVVAESTAARSEADAGRPLELARRAADRSLELARRAADRVVVEREGSRSTTILAWTLRPATTPPVAASTEDPEPTELDAWADHALLLLELAGQLAERDAALSARAAEVQELLRELESTSHGLLVLHDELDRARESEARLAAIVRSSDDAMYSFAPDGTLLTWNAGAERLLGYPAHEVVGRPVGLLVPERCRPEFDAGLDRVVEGENAIRYEAWRTRRDGSDVEVAVTLSAIRAPHGALVGFSAVLRDLTEQRSREAELAAAEASREVFAERDRIARDLHDFVIQRLFASGMMLQAARVLTSSDPGLDERVAAVVDDLDETIRQIRTTIFGLGSGSGRATGLRGRILDVASKAAAVLGYKPVVDFEGAVDAMVSREVGEELLAVVSEALSNIARHAEASSARLVLEVGEEIVLTVSDNGRGLGETSRRSGLANLAERASRLGGSCAVGDGPAGGTRIEWRVPLDLDG